MIDLPDTRSKSPSSGFTFIKRRPLISSHGTSGRGNAMLSLVPSILILLLASPANSQLAPETSAVAAANGHSPVVDHTDIAKEPDKVPPGEDEGALRRELAAARAELARQAQVLKEQRQTDEALTLNLETAQRVIENFRAEASHWDSGKGAMAEAQPASEASQAAATRALDDERHKAELLEQELTAARQTIDALKAAANLAAQERAKAVKARQVADAASNQAGQALKLERERADAAIRDLESARKERDALKQNSMELSAALEQERERANGLARSLSAAREEIDVARDKRRSAAVERAPKARTNALASSSSRSGAARNPGLPKKQKVKGPKPPQTVLLATTALPIALLPTRPPAQ
ncbi:hypothetical protein [Mesorhizobium sp. B2-4-17]|uniref:hypothetical protein n=1 Tax=Mesorhizobium sp. B2-4-17 TaxID=2589932 RepID=UPI00112A8FFC|nr:hypothetical protein [Mesorhizobium sp. B2-4-17]TPK89481.1 hypothetical protein FJ548_10325 [Mesorhizobium sp. B2-4-17]